MKHAVQSRYDTVWRHGGASEPHPQAVTVAVSLYNYERFVGPCLASVRNQTHPHLELVVVDDTSDLDGSAATARSWMADHADRFEHALLVRHVRNSGLAAARNTAFRLARTEHVFVLDADNLLYPPALDKLHAAISDGGYDAAYSQLELFGHRREIGIADVWSRRRLSHEPYIDAMALVRRRSWERVGGYDHIDGGWEDYDFWCKFAESGMTGLFVPEILCRYRVHGTSMTDEHTRGSLAQIIVEMSARHPWLRLPPAA